MMETVHIALGLVCAEGRWLVSRRSAGRSFADHWEFPGGKMLDGETPETGAVREVREETGLEVEPTGSLGQVATAHEGRGLVLHLVLCRPVAGQAGVNDPAVVEVRWVDAVELHTLNMPPANARIIERLPGVQAG